MAEPKPGNQIVCPSCGSTIDVHDALHHQLESELKQQFAEQRASEQKKMAVELAAIEEQRVALDASVKQQAKQTREAIERGIKERESALADSIKQKLQSEQAEQLAAMNKELSEKSSQLKEFNRIKSDIERLKREKEEMRDALEVENQQKLNQALATEKEKVRQAVEEKNQLDLAERNKVISDLNEKLKEAQRKAEQGSMQLQGEVMELAIEQWLKEQFPLDTIEEIKKGATGADCLQIIHTRSRQNCGSIYYESKRTKAFSPTWIEKFRQDIRDKNADVGVLVTQTMPADMPQMGLRDGVWICTFQEFRGLSLVLREAAIKMSEALVAQDNKGDKMGMLYDFLTGGEFRQQVEAIVEGFTQMQTDLASEKRAMQKIWKQREKQIEKVLLNTTGMYGSIQGIAGEAIGTVSLLELSEATDD
ncbi:MAG: DUF2130 domain-containing protein [Acidiferrobacterales bacterium]|nr:DUF2130 domain-containing protein [Acidiferrobacterales bacterium]